MLGTFMNPHLPRIEHLQSIENVHPTDTSNLADEFLGEIQQL